MAFFMCATLLSFETETTDQSEMPQSSRFTKKDRNGADYTQKKRVRVPS
jgi:hypothetical protein